MSRLRVLIVEDSLTVRKRMCEVLNSDGGIEVVGEATDGQQGVDMCLALRPDVVTMDMMLPIMNGLVATEHIMAHCPTPILVVSALERQVLFRTFDALAAGAVEVLDKPTGEDGADEAWSRRLIATVKLVARIRVITHVRGKLSPTPAALNAPVRANGAPRASCPQRDAAGGPGRLHRRARSAHADPAHAARAFARAAADRAAHRR
ncbi:MAG: response regulator [Aquabacterium sp.]